MLRPDRLVVLGSTLTALAVVRAARAIGLPTFLLDTRRGMAFDSRCPTACRLVPADDVIVLQALGELARGRRAALVVDNDAWLRFVVRQRAALDALFATVLHPEVGAIETCLDKSRFLRWCVEHALPAPRRHARRSDGRLEPPAEFPLLLRPETTRHESGTKVPKAVEVADEASLATWLAAFDAAGVVPSIAQSLLRPGIRQYSVGVARSRTGALRCMVAEKLRSLPEQCAGGTYVVLSSQRDVLALAVRALEALRYVGIAEVEVLRDDASGECFLIEINARPWVQLGLAEKAGLGVLAFALGLDEGPAAGRPTRWLNFEADAYVCLARDGGVVRSGRVGWAPYLLSLLRANAYAVWDWRDPWPFVRSGWRLLRRFA